MKYYIYGLVDPISRVIKYVGKGSKYRIFQHVKLVKRGIVESNNFTKFHELKKLLDLGYEDIAYQKFFETDSESEAYKKEIELIEKYKTHISKGGWNITKGGSGGISHVGKKHSQETKEKISNALKGRKLSEEHRLNLSKSLKGHKTRLGKTHSAETRQKISDNHVGMLGKRHTPESIEKMKKPKTKKKKVKS